MIVKVQQSLFNSESRKMMLIYNEKRTVFHESELTEHVEKALNGRPKAYFQFRAIKDGEILLGKEVQDQNW